MSVVHQLSTEEPGHELLISNLHHLMAQQDITEAELARQTAIPQPTLHKILSGKTNDPRISTLKAIADYFSLPLDDLYSQNASIDKKPAAQGQSVPVISWEDCANSSNPTAGLTPTNWENWVIINHMNHENIYALVSKPSMEPRFPKGTLLITDSTMMPNDGDLVIVKYPNTNAATLRELSIDGPNKLLLPFKQGIPVDQLNENIQVIGTVIQSRFSYQS